ncbi:MAG TPA: hypothetical protein VIK75_00050 [Calditerricola sp.]
MRIVPASRHPRLFRYEMVFLFGLLCGAVLCLYVVGQQVDRYHLTLKTLTLENAKLQEEVRALQDKLKARSAKPVVRQVEVVIVNDNLDAFLQAEIMSHVKKEARFLVGLPVNSLLETHRALVRLLGNQTVTVDDRAYRLALRTLVVGETVVLYMDAQPAAQPMP